MSDAEFLAFNTEWIERRARLAPRRRRLGDIHRLARLSRPFSPRRPSLALNPLNLIIWAKTNAGHGEPLSLAARALAAVQKGQRRMSTISNSAKRAAGARTSGPIPALLHLARTRGGASRIIRPSSRRPCWRMLSSISPIAAKSSSTLSWVGLDTDRRRRTGQLLPRRRARSTLRRCHPPSLPTGNR